MIKSGRHYSEHWCRTLFVAATHVGSSCLAWPPNFCSCNNFLYRLGRSLLLRLILCVMSFRESFWEPVGPCTTYCESVGLQDIHTHICTCTYTHTQIITYTYVSTCVANAGVMRKWSRHPHVQSSMRLVFLWRGLHKHNILHETPMTQFLTIRCSCLLP